MTTELKIPGDQYEAYRTVILSGQMSHRDVQAILTDSDFAAWYEANSLPPSGTPAAVMRDAVEQFMDAIGGLPPDVRLLGAVEATAQVIAAGWPTSLVPEITARTISCLPAIVDRYEHTLADIKQAGAGANGSRQP